MDWNQRGQDLASERRRQGLTQSEVGASIGVHRRTVERIEKGDGARVAAGTVAAYERLVGLATAA